MFINTISALFIFVGAVHVVLGVERGPSLYVHHAVLALGVLWVGVGLGLWRRKELARLAGLALLLQFMWWMVLIPVAFFVSGLIFLIVAYLHDLLNGGYAAAAVLALVWGLPFFGSLWSYRRFQSDTVVSQFIASQPVSIVGRIKIYLTAVIFFVLPFFWEKQFVIY